MASSSESVPAGPAAPVSGTQRQISLDFIRGVAVLGILFANIVAFGQPMLAYGWPGAFPEPMSSADTAVWLFQLLFIDGKMRGLFTLLFGAGLVLFLERARARGEGRGRQVARLLLLAGFGLLHFFFLFWGDILFIYGAAGLFALLMVNWPARRQLVAGLVWYVMGGLLFALALAIPMNIEREAASTGERSPAHEQVAAQWQEREAEAERERAAYGSGSYRAELAFMVEERSDLLAQYPVLALFETIPLMLIGMAVYRLRLFSGQWDARRVIGWSGFGIAASLAVMLPLGLWAMRAGFPPHLTEFVTSGAAQVPRLPMILALAALLSLLAGRAAQGWLGARLIAAGRMAFSNYIGTSVLMMLVFRSWAGGLFGQLGRAEMLLIVLLGWAAMLAWSAPWLARFRYGPLEWVWRCLTYGRLFAFRR